MKDNRYNPVPHVFEFHLLWNHFGFVYDTKVRTTLPSSCNAILIDVEINENVHPVKLNVDVSCGVFNYSAFQPINLIIMMSLKAKHWEECQVNGTAEPFILLSYTLTYKQRIKHLHVLGINVFSCTADVSDEVCGLKFGLSRLLGTQAPSQRKSSLSRHAC